MVYLHKTGLPYKHYKNTYHLLADDVNELYLFAKKIDLKMEWIQDIGPVPHYDVFGSKIKKAIAAGAKVISRKKAFEIIRKYIDSRIDNCKL